MNFTRKMPFGQFKNWYLHEIPRPYLEWLSKEPQVWPRFKKEIDQVLQWKGGDEEKAWKKTLLAWYGESKDLFGENPACLTVLREATRKLALELGKEE